MRRVPSRQVGVEVPQGSLDFGVVTFQPAERGLLTMSLGPDELVMLVHPQHPLAGRKEVTMAEFGRETVIAHNDPSPARERVLRAFEQKHAPINIQIALPSLEAIKRAVEMKMGVALLPRRCALDRDFARPARRASRMPQVQLSRGSSGSSTAAPASCRTPPTRSSRWRERTILNRLADRGKRILSGFRPQASGIATRATGSGCGLRAANYSLPAIHYPLSTTHYALPTTHYPLPTTEPYPPNPLM